MVRAGRARLPATSLEDDYSTKVEGATIRRALLDVEAEVEAHESLELGTDSYSWVQG